MRKLHSTGFDTADFIIKGLANLNYLIEPADRILDFGCGDGALVYRFRDLGYEAYGFDIHRYVALRKPADEALFKFFANPQIDSSNMTVLWSNYSLPFESDTFDLVVSSQTLEHVLNPTPVMAEIARVLRRDGLGLHLYPDRSWIIEPHLLVPFATRFQSWWWFYLWSALGIRNSFQTGLTTRQVADNNFRYGQTGVRYLTNAKMRMCASPYFQEVLFSRDAFYGFYDRKAVRRARWLALRSKRPLADLAPLPKLNVLLTARKRMRCGKRLMGPFYTTANGHVAKMPNALLKVPLERILLFRDGRFVGKGESGGEVDTLVIAPAHWPDHKVAATKFDIAVGRVEKLNPPFYDYPGYMFGCNRADLKHLADDRAPGHDGSPIFVLEDGAPLDYSHSLHDHIVNFGGGRYSHWGQEILFSSSDDSDPRSNGRTYEIVIVEPDSK
jgi:SAM-dependent methyltransferase